MKILKVGKIPRVIELEKFKHTCLNCDTLFEYDFTDVKLFGFSRISVVCPFCHEAIDLVNLLINKDRLSEYQQRLWTKFVGYYYK